MTKLNKKGFTLIEIIAAIVILGIIMMIAVPNVSSRIIEHRKKTYIINANRFVDSARDFVNSESVKMDSQTITYYIPRTCLSVDKANKSPYGEWDQVYVVVTFDGTKYDYYFTANDETKTGIELTYSEDLSIKRVTSNVKKIDVKRSIGLRNSTLVFTDSCKEQDAVKYRATSNIGEHESYEGSKTTLIINSVTISETDWTSNNITIVGKAEDKTKGITGYAISTYKSLDKDSPLWTTVPNTTDEITFRKTVSENNLYYFYVRNGDGEVEKKAVSIAIIDKEPPSCKIIGTGNIQCTDNVGIIGYYFGPLDPRSNAVTFTPVDQIKNYYNTISTDYTTEKFLIAEDIAHNRSGVVSNQRELDTTPPVCTLVKTMAGYSVGVTVTVLCTDEAGGSGCDSSRNITGERGVKSSKTYTIYDNAGNHTSCSINIEPTQVVAGLVCKRNKERTCPANPTSSTNKTYQFDSNFITSKETCEQLGFHWTPGSGGFYYGTTGYCSRDYTQNNYASGGYGGTTKCSNTYSSNVDDCLQWSSVVRYKSTAWLWSTYCGGRYNNSFEMFSCETVYY